MITTISPIDGTVVLETKSHSSHEIDETVANATNAFHKHRQLSLSTRIQIARKFLDYLQEEKDGLVCPVIIWINSGEGNYVDDGPADSVYSEGN